MPANSRTRSILVQRHRQRLFEMLGGQCALHGDTCSGPLEIDHPHGRNWTPSKVSSYQRNLRYLREAEAGTIRLLCKYHNETVRPGRAGATNQPF